MYEKIKILLTLAAQLLTPLDTWRSKWPKWALTTISTVEHDKNLQFQMPYLYVLYEVIEGNLQNL